MRGPGVPTGWRVWGSWGVLEVPQRLAVSPMVGGTKNVIHVCSIIIFVFNALSYCLCRQWNYHSEIRRINSSLSSLPCPPSSPPNRLRFGRHTWLPYNWPLLCNSISSSCLVGGCHGSTKETRKGENKEGECNWLWIKKRHLLVYHPGPTCNFRDEGTRVDDLQASEQFVVTFTFLVGCPLETHRDAHTLKPPSHLPHFSKTSSVCGQHLLLWIETSVFRTQGITFILTFLHPHVCI